MQEISKPRIWYLLPELKLGGAEKHVIALASGLRKKGYAVGIACLFREGALAEDVRREGIPFVCFNRPEIWGPGIVWRIWQWLRANRVDILHTYLFGFHFFAGLPARFAKIPAVLSSRRELAVWKRRRHRWIEDMGNLFVDRVVCCSQAVRNGTLEKENIVSEKLLVIYNGVDAKSYAPKGDSVETRRRFGIPDGAAVVGTIANFGQEKGYRYFLEAAQQVLKRFPSTYFLCIGFGPLLEDMRNKARQIEHGEHIVFLGKRTDISSLLEVMDVFVLASTSEGFPNVLLEAMAAGKPLVATHVGGIPELVESGKEGILVPAGDGIALATQIMSLLQDRPEAMRVGMCAREKIEKRFTLERMVDDYEKLYLSLWIR